VRKELLDFQRRFSLKGWLVCEGRDTGSIVFPHALYKFYLDANIQERARRRHLESKDNTSVEEIEKLISQRDKNDSERKTAPLVIPDDAIFIDTSDKTIDEITSILLKCSASIRQ
ncbi:MAG: (d)CMP kinase, partial [Nitrospinae bacterium]|nr:(d)CMP kinase [Nitrospinota bacterium]